MQKRALFPKVQATKSPPYTFPRFSTSSSTSSLTTLIASLQQCALSKALRKGLQVHAQLLTMGLHSTSPSASTSLINMYAKCNQINQALLVFNNTHDRNRNVFVYNAMIFGFISHGLADNGLNIYWEMRKTGILPDKYTFPCLIKGFCEVMEVLEVEKIHGLVVKSGLVLDRYVGSALVSSYLKFELMEEACELFDEMPEKDIVLWNSLVNGYARSGRFAEALGVFQKMSKEGVSISKFTASGVLSAFAMMGDFENGRVIHGLVIKLGFVSSLCVCNALIDMYGKCKCADGAVEIFYTMSEKDIISWNSILFTLELCGDHGGTLRFFDRMLDERVRPDLVTITTVLPACSHLAALMHGRGIHGYIIVNGLAKDGDIIKVNNAVTNMYAKCGNMRDAHLVFEKMGNRDIASWNIMIMGYGMHGYGNEALDVFSRMCETGLKPSDLTFVGVLLACSHAGLVDQGREFFWQMGLKYGVVPTIEHYACIIDMLGRAGHLEEAYQLTIKMPIDANPIIWRALLASCRLHGNADLAEVVAQQVLQLDPAHCGNYVLMSNIYVDVGRYQEVLDVRHTMRQQNVKKTPGCSWIELKNGMNTFTTGDQNHPEAKSIHSELHLLTAHLREHGYVPLV